MSESEGPHQSKRQVLGAVQRGWQPALSIAAIFLSATSYREAQRANDLAERQFNAEQQRLKDDAEQERRKARQVLLFELREEGKEIHFRLASSDVNLNQIAIDFPRQSGVPTMATRPGRTQMFDASLLRPLARRVSALPGSKVVNNELLWTTPVLVTTNYIGRGDSHYEFAIYDLTIRSTLVGGSPQLTFDDLRLGGAVQSGQLGARLIAECWPRYAVNRPRHDQPMSELSWEVCGSRNKDASSLSS